MPSIESNRKLVTGSFWISVSEGFTAIASLATAIIAARVLAPEDFGLMGIIFLVLAILEAFTRTGFERALIQKQDDPTPYLNVAFTWHLGRGVLLAVAMFLAAPFVAAFYDEPILAPTLAFAGLYVLFIGAKNPGEIFFTRDLNFKVVCAINVARSLLKLFVAIPAIFLLQNVWALAIEFVVGALAALVISYVAHPFRPRLEWDWPRAKELIKFGKWIFGLTILGFFMNKGDDLFLSKYMGAVALGLYYYAFEISNWPATKVTHVLSRVSFPTYSRLQDHPEELRRAFTNVMRATLLITGPLSVAIFVLAPYLVTFVIGPQWQPIVPLIQILVIAGMVRSFQALGGALFQACGNPGLDFKMNLPRAAVLLLTIWPLTAHFGLAGACLSVVLALAVSLPVWFYGVRTYSGLRLRDVFRENILAFITSAVLFCTLAGLDAYLFAALPTWYGALATVVGGLALWAGLMYLIGRVSPWKLYREVLNLKAVLTKQQR